MKLGLVAIAAFVGGWCAASARASRRETLRARFLSFVAHELNSPLSAMNMTVLNFVNGVFGPVPKEHLPWLVMLKEQVERLGEMIGDLRDLVHAEFHRDLDLDRETVSLEELLDRKLDSMKDALSRAGIPVEKRLRALPKVSADPDRIGRVLAAMLANARKFRSSGPITLSGRLEGGDPVICVEYAGPKAAPDALKGALDLFFPVRNKDSQVLAGTGLGLGLAGLLVAAHGGSMALEAQADGLRRITVRLPREKA